MRVEKIRVRGDAGSERLVENIMKGATCRREKDESKRRRKLKEGKGQREKVMKRQEDEKSKGNVATRRRRKAGINKRYNMRI